MKLGLVFGTVLFLLAGITIAGNSREVKGLSDLEITNIAAQATSNATATALEEANKLLGEAKNATANATQAGIEQARSVMANVANNVSNATSNTTVKAMNEANKLIGAASTAASNATANGSTNVTAETKTYENRDIGIKFQYPSDWGKLIEGDCHKQEFSCFITSGDSKFSFGLDTTPKENYNSLMDRVRSIYNSQSSSLDGFSFKNDNRTVVGKNNSGWQYEFSYIKNDGVNSEGHSVFTANNGKYYSFIIVYPQELGVKHLPEFKKIIDSVEFLPIQVAKTPSFMNANETQEPKSSTTDNNTIFEKTLPPITVGAKQASLYTKITPPDKKQNALFQLRLIDNKTGKNITNVNYFLTISKGNNQVLRELFYSKEGPLTLKFQPNQSPVTVHGTTEPFLGGWTDESGQITVSGPVLTEGGQYNYAVEIFGIDNVRNIFKPENAPRFDSSFSMKMNETEQTKPSLPLESNPNGVQILSYNSFIDSIGYFHVVGEVMNNTPTVAQFVQVTGTFYDNNNQVVATDFTYTNPSDIGSGQKAPFEITLLSASIPVSQVDHYNLVASSQ